MPLRQLIFCAWKDELQCFGAVVGQRIHSVKGMHVGRLHVQVCYAATTRQLDHFKDPLRFISRNSLHQFRIGDPFQGHADDVQNFAAGIDVRTHGLRVLAAGGPQPGQSERDVDCVGAKLLNSSSDPFSRESWPHGATVPQPAPTQSGPHPWQLADSWYQQGQVAAGAGLASGYGSSANGYGCDCSLLRLDTIVCSFLLLFRKPLHTQAHSARSR